MKLQLDPKWKWVAQDRDRVIYLFSGKPTTHKGYWNVPGDQYRLNTDDVFCTPNLGPDWRDSLHEILPDGTLRKPLPDLKVDDKVLVSNCEGIIDIPRHFSHFDNNSNIHCFRNGTTSFSNIDKLTNPWNYWKLP